MASAIASKCARRSARVTEHVEASEANERVDDLGPPRFERRIPAELAERSLQATVSDRRVVRLPNRRARYTEHDALNTTPRIPAGHHDAHESLGFVDERTPEFPGFTLMAS